MKSLYSLVPLRHSFAHTFNMPWLDGIALIICFFLAILLAVTICFSILDTIPQSRPKTSNSFISLNLRGEIPQSHRETINVAAVLIGSIVSLGAWIAIYWFTLVFFAFIFSESRDLLKAFPYLVLVSACLLNLLSIAAIGQFVRERTKSHRPRLHAFAVGLLFIVFNLLFVPDSISFGQPIFVYVLTLLVAAFGDIIFGAIFIAGLYVWYLLSDKNPDASQMTSAGTSQRPKTPVWADKSKSTNPALATQLTRQTPMKNRRRVFIVTPEGIVFLQGQQSI